MEPAVFRPYRETDLDVVSRLWHIEYEETSPQFAGRHSPDDFRGRMLDYVLPTAEVTVAVRNGAVVGFMALKPGYTDQLYIRADSQSRGIGSAFVRAAKGKWPEGLELHTLASNARAIAFYEGHGFEVVERGIAPDEGAPDVMMRWSGGE